MSIDHRRAKRPHCCDLPTIRTIEFAPTPPGTQATQRLQRPSVLVHHPQGTRFTCEVCGRRWKVVRRPDNVDGRVLRVGGLEWRPGSLIAARARRWLDA